MPNWVFNSLVVSGEKSELDRMVAQLNQPMTKHFPESNYDRDKQEWVNTPSVQVYNNPVFSFWNVIAPTNLEAYYGEEVHKNRDKGFNADGTLDSEAFMEEFTRSMSEDNDWYHWNCRNWGTKWDIAVQDNEQYASTRMEITDDGDVMYHFETAWSPVHSVLTKLSEQYPALSFDYEYEEEQGWGGRCTFQSGNIVSEEEWDIPSSHADYEALDRECNCVTDIDSDYWFEDCPVDADRFKWNGEFWEDVLDSLNA